MDAHKSYNSNTVFINNINQHWRKGVFLVGAIFCLTPFAGPASALLLGLVVAQFAGQLYPDLRHKVTQTFLQASVVGLGFGMNIQSALAAGRVGLSFTIISIAGTLTLGYFLGRWLRIDVKTSFLISSGTAICGGSAIAAVSPVIKAGEKPVSIALGCVFIFNAVALFVFPLIGRYFGLSQTQFGLWCAVAIHDTSSVIGAAGKFGNQALQIATAVKLARALWIVPVTFIASCIFKNGNGKVKLPWFIGLFIIAVILNTYLPVIVAVRPFIITTAKTGLTLCLFLIGTGLSRTALASVGIKPLLQALVLWIVISGVSLFAVLRLA